MSDNIDNIDTSIARDTAKYAPLTPKQRADKQAKFIKAYCETGNIKYSCKRAGVTRQTFYDWQANDEAFSKQLPDADLSANDTLEHAAFERAVNGVPSFVVSQGKMVYEDYPATHPDGTPLIIDGKQVMLHGKPLVERKYSDALLTTLLKSRMPDKYNRQQLEVTGKDGGPVRVDYSQYSTEELTMLEQLAMKGHHGNS